MMRRCSRVLLYVLMLPVLVACAAMQEINANRMPKVHLQDRLELLEQYEQTKNPQLLSKIFKINPIVAAVNLAPERIPEMIANGVDVNYQVPAAPARLVFHREPTTALISAIRLETPKNIQVMQTLLEAGADPDLLTPLCYVAFRALNDNDGAVEIASVLLKYGANPDIRCDDPYGSPYTIVEDANNWRMRGYAEFLSDAQSSGLEVAIANYENREQRLAQEKRDREAVEAEKQRQIELAREIRQEKKAAIEQTFRESADLNAALNSVKESARPCRTLDRMGFQVDEFNCMFWVQGEVYPSPSCERYQAQLSEVVYKQRDQFCEPYKKQRQQLANLFGTNASLANDVIGEAISGTENIADIENQYRAEIRRMQTIRDREARGERAEAERREQEGMYNFAKYVEQSVGSKTAADQIIEKSVADTQHTLFAIDSAQKMAKINADLEAINNRLKAIETTPSVAPAVTSSQSTNQTSTSKASPASENTPCVAQSESKGPMNNVPKRYCQYVFSDNTDNVKLDWSDYTNEFNEESGSLKQAQDTIQLPLLKKARQVCEGRGYKRVHHPDTFEFNQVAHQVTECKENKRMESTFHLCVGTASFICAR